MKTTPLQIFYGLLAIIGVCVTWYFNIQPMEQSYISGLYANPASTSFTNDLIVVVTAFLVWSFLETRKLGMPKWLWPVGFVLTFAIAAAMTVPLFLLLRERQLLKNAA
ncbi:MAG: DUF2834 domain-containing protein [Pseudohongiellaceae bacterium]